MNKRNLHVLAASCFLFNSVMLFAQTDTAKGVSEKNYRLYSMKLGKEVSMKDIAEDMKNYDVVFYGEEHNDSVTHYAEKTLFKTLYDKYNSAITLSMEMFERDEQEVMNEYLGGFIREKEFKHDARVWSNYRDYRPMVELAKEKQSWMLFVPTHPAGMETLQAEKEKKPLKRFLKHLKNTLLHYPTILLQENIMKSYRKCRGTWQVQLLKMIRQKRQRNPL